MSGWNYRLVRREGVYPKHMNSHPWSYVAIHEVYYDDEGNPDSCTKEAIDIGAETAEECLEVHNDMGLAFTKPVLEMKMFTDISEGKRNVH